MKTRISFHGLYCWIFLLLLVQAPAIGANVLAMVDGTMTEDCTGVPLWDAAATYVGGNEVQFEGQKYRANWWTQSNPAQNNGGPGSGQPWTLLGPCGSTNPIPVVTITAPVSGNSFDEGTNVQVTADATDDGSVTQVNFLVNGSSIGIDQTSPYSVPWNNIPAGQQVITAIATDDQGATGTSAEVVVTVNSDQPNIAPIVAVTSPSDGASFDEGLLISISANASDADGTVTQVEFFDGSISLGVDTQSPYAFDWSGATVGAHTLQAVVTDNLGAMSSASITITVDAVSIEGCNGLPVYGPYPQVYQTGDIVQYEGNRYECLANNLFNVVPGTAAHWWALLGPCTNIPVNEDPEVTITTPANGSQFVVGSNLTIEAAATDDGSVVSVEFFVDGASIGVDNSAPYGAVWNNATAGSHNLTAVATDDEGATGTSSVVRINDGTVTTTPLARHIMVGYWHNFDNGAAVLELGEVSQDWDVVNIAFAEPATFGRADMAFVPSTDVTTEAQFRQDVQTLQNRGQKVLISIGGANGRIELLTPADATEFADAMIAIIEDYGFDGLDIDLEGTSLGLSTGDNDFRNPTSSKIVNFIAGMEAVLDHFGTDFILTAAPETAFVQGGTSTYAGSFGAYLPVLYHFRNELDYLHVQDYNSGCMLGLDGVCYSQGNADFHVAMTEMLLQGFPVAGHSVNFPAFRADQVAFGVPASPQAAGGGYTVPTDIQQAMDYLINGTSFGGNYTLVNAAGYPEMRGLMTWSINWDVFSGFGFSNPHRAYLDNLLNAGVAARSSLVTEAPEQLSPGQSTVYPNPFLDEVTLNFELLQSTEVSLQVLDQLGRVIDRPLEYEWLDKGNHRVRWKAPHLPGGMYFYRLMIGEEVQVYRVLKLE